ncbi:MAG: branched-chain amino acid ABC transporter substrate-binding protein [Gemmatimonadota bacterium]|nr:branched-chain amino acid ABC transporter substrate-binding protein [Gemmatimonadota bacterium]
MSTRVRSLFLFAIVAAVTWGCGGERLTTSQVPEADRRTGQPLSKLAVSGDTTPALVVARVIQGENPVSGVTVEIARSISGRVADYEASGTTGANGVARVEVGGSGGYYRARAMQDGSMLGSWSSIPINGGYETSVDLPVGDKARVTATYERALVAIGEGQAVHIRSLLTHTIAVSLGDPSRNAVELAVRDYGTVHGRNVELGEPIDGMCGPEGGRSGAEQIVADSRVLGVVGTSCSGAAVAASPVISAAGLVMISPSNTSPRLTSDLAGNANPDYHPGYFRVAINDLYQARAVADFAYNELGLRRMAAVDDGDPYTTALVSAFGDAFAEVGGEVPVSARIEKGQADMTPVLTDFAEAGPDGIFFPLFDEEGLPFAKQVREFDGLEGVTLITGAALLDSEFLATPQSEGVYAAGPEADLGSNVNAVTGKSVDEALAAYDAAYGGFPGTPYWAHSYDATTLLLSAIESVAIARDEELIVDRNALRRELHATSDFQALAGTLACDEFGDCGTGRINIYHHTDTSVTDPSQLSVVYRFVP